MYNHPCLTHFLLFTSCLLVFSLLLLLSHLGSLSCSGLVDPYLLLWDLFQQCDVKNFFEAFNKTQVRLESHLLEMRHREATGLTKETTSDLINLTCELKWMVIWKNYRAWPYLPTVLWFLACRSTVWWSVDLPESCDDRPRLHTAHSCNGRRSWGSYVSHPYPRSEPPPEACTCSGPVCCAKG